MRTLVIGYGNMYRADDGVAHYVVNSLRNRLGKDALSEDETGLEELGAQNDTVLLLQLVPELVDTLAAYDQVVFVDAHVRDDVPDLHHTSVCPEYALSAFTHHMTPGMLLSLVKMLQGCEPIGHIVSIRGHDFDFHRGLSVSTLYWVEPAVEVIAGLLGEGVVASNA